MRTAGNPENGSNRIVVVGGGPAGLTAAMELQKAGLESIVLEKDCVVGGAGSDGSLQGLPLRYRRPPVLY